MWKSLWFWHCCTSSKVTKKLISVILAFKIEIKFKWDIGLSEVSLHLLNSISTPRDSVQHFLVLLQSWMPNWCKRMQNGNDGRAPPLKWQQPMTPAGFAPVAASCKKLGNGQNIWAAATREKERWHFHQLINFFLLHHFSQKPKSIWPIHPYPLTSLFQMGTKHCG